MNLAAIERRICASKAGAIVADARLLRRIIKQHRALPGLGLSVPHAGSYVLAREALLRIIDPARLGRSAESLPAQVILVARPSPSELAGRDDAEVLTRLWRGVFHAQVHVAVEARIASGALDDAALRERIHRIGQIEFDEIRAALRSEDRLLPPAGDREVYLEFAALYLELRHFAPRLLGTMFPALPEDGKADAVLALDVDIDPLLDRSFPEGAERAATVVRSPARRNTTTLFTAASFTLWKDAARPAPTGAAAAGLLAAAEEAKQKGNLARAAILRLSAQHGDHARATAAARADLDALSARLTEALAQPGGDASGPAAAAWTSLLLMLAERAAARRLLRYPIEARLLFDLQRAALAHERPERAVDVATWALSGGKQPVVRPLPATRETKIARHVHRAARKVRYARIAAADRKLLGKLLRWASERSEANVRAALRPTIKEAFEAVGLRPGNVPERVARGKLTEELLDQVVERGFISLGPLRDAVSRNQLKLENLAGARELLRGDALLLLDRRLARSLDGVYRGGEIYLRFLHKLSSIAFGTDAGRTLTLYAILPLLSGYVVLVGGAHLIELVLRVLGLEEVNLVTIPAFVFTTAVIFGLLHSEAIRRVSLRALRLLGAALSVVFFRAPRWVLSRPAVRRFMVHPVTRGVVKKGLVPLGLAAALTWATPLGDQAPEVAIGGGIALFALLAGVMSSPLGTLLADAFFDWIGPAFQAVSRRVLPGLFRLIVETFRAFMDVLERVLYQVDEWLRFREGDDRLMIAPKAVLGLVWFAVAYAIRLYITLLIEPELNPLKHFPSVTVAQKLMVTSAPEILRALNAALAPLGPVIGGTIAGITAFLLPSVAGFLVWELKENWKLYRKSRAKQLAPMIVIGHHGETMGALLTPGFHSGTLPKLYARLRRAAQREDEAQLASVAVMPGGAVRASRGHGAEDHFREGVLAVEEAVFRFVERELTALLLRVPRWTHGLIEITAIEPGSNRIRLQLTCKGVDPAPLEIAFEEQSGLLLASIPRAGFVEKLPEGSAGRRLFENALAGLYQRAGVDLVREQIEDALGRDTPYDISEEGLIAWPGKGYDTEVVVPLRDRDAGGEIMPVVRGAPLATAPVAIEAARLDFRLQSIAWTAWLEAWSAAEKEGVPIPRLVARASILPGLPGGERAARERAAATS